MLGAGRERVHERFFVAVASADTQMDAHILGAVWRVHAQAGDCGAGPATGRGLAVDNDAVHTLTGSDLQRGGTVCGSRVATASLRPREYTVIPGYP
jgi:hypothetical protein